MTKKTTCKFEHYSVCHHIKHKGNKIRCTDNIKEMCPYYTPKGGSEDGKK